MSRTSFLPVGVVVIGAANGIGAATARRLAAAGTPLLLADVEREPLEALSRALGGPAHGAHVRTVDVRDASGLTRLAAESAETLGGLHAVINCAAVIRPASLLDAPLDDIWEQVDINLTGAILVARAFLPHLVAQRRGHLVNVASLGGLVPLPGSVVYSATKFGVRGFSLALALDAARHGVAVSVICPDSADTRQLRAEAGHPDSALSFTSAPLTADDVARAIVRTLRHPRREVLVPRPRGVLIRLLVVFPALFARLVPLLTWLGQRGRRRYQLRHDPPQDLREARV
jgi:3-oxoacyl-[acyl-carrier protein] reductase